MRVEDEMEMGFEGTYGGELGLGPQDRHGKPLL